MLLRIRQKKSKKTVNYNLPLNVTASTGLTIITEIGAYQTKDTDTYTKIRKTCTLINSKI